MATNITNSFEALMFSSDLPDHIVIQTAAKSVVVKIYVEGDKIFESTYYPYNGWVYVRDVASLVEARMEEQSYAMASFNIDIDDGTGISSIDEPVKVIYSKFKIVGGAAGYVGSHFLTTRKRAIIPRNGYVTLANYTEAYAAGNNHAVIHYSVPYIPGEIFVYDGYLGKIQATTTKIFSTKLTHEYFQERLETNLNRTDATINAVEYHIGSRDFNIFFTDEEPDETFVFLNAFNLTETAYIYGVSTIKTEVERSEAVCNKRLEFYDETVKVKHEVETAPMPYEDALWLNQMLCSKWVARKAFNDRTIEVLISDISSEVDDSSKNLVKIKFSWQYATGMEWK